MRKRIRLQRKPRRAEVSSSVVEQREADLSSTFAAPIERTLFLQRTIGNKGVQALIESGAFHEKSGTASPSRRSRPTLYAVPENPVRTAVLRQPVGCLNNARTQSGFLSDRISAAHPSRTKTKISTTRVPDISRKAEARSKGMQPSTSTPSEVQPERSAKEPLVADSTSDHDVSQLGANQVESKSPLERRGQQGLKRNANVNRKDAKAEKSKGGESAKKTGDLRKVKSEQKPKKGTSGVKEKTKVVEALSFDGNSEQIMESFSTASASQMAVSYPSLGGVVSSKLNQEQAKEAANAPVLVAQSSGVKESSGTGKGKVPDKETAQLKDGFTETERAKQQLAPHKDYAGPPQNERNNQTLEKHGEGGFLSWFKKKFTSFVSAVATSDSGLKTGAGQRPVIDTTGKANPERSENQRQEGEDQVQVKKAQTVDQINTNPGQKQIQPVDVNEPKPVTLSKEVSASVETGRQQDMAEYAVMPLPSSVRTAADTKMHPILEKGLAKPRQNARDAANKRDTEKQNAINKTQKDAKVLNEQADKEQKDAVIQHRGEVASEQEKGIREAQEKMDGFNTEVNKEHLVNKKNIKDRINKDQSDAAKKLDDAETEAEQLRKKGEEDAKEKKKELKKESKKKSWWDRAVSAVKSAVKTITKAIDGIFNWVREKVKQVIDAAKKAALDLIEAGRKWVIDKLDAFGDWLKDKVNKYLSDFPGLAERINSAIDTTVGVAKKAVNAVADKLKAGVEALANGLGKVLDKVLSTFQTGLKAAVQIYGAVLTGDFAEAAKIAFMAACEIAGINPQPILNFIEKAGEKIKDIFKAPVAFFRNVASGIKLGLQKFMGKIKKHLVGGLVGWLTGALSAGNITPPEKFDLKGVFSLVMQILGLTVENIKAKVIKKSGPKGEKLFETIKKSVSIVKKLITKGPIALWEWVKDSLSNLKDIVMSGIRDWVITTVIKEGIIWVLSLLNPASAIVKAIKLLYDVVMFFVERYQQIIEFAKSVFNSVAELAAGNISKAANAVENALARSVPVIISFLASLVGLGGIGSTIRNIIGKIRKPIDFAIDKVVGSVVKKGKALFKKGKALFQRGKAAVKKGPKKGKDLPGKFTEKERQGGMKAFDTEEKKYVKEGAITREDAQKTAVDVKKKHPVFKSIAVIDGKDSWNYKYVFRSGGTVDTPAQKAESGAKEELLIIPFSMAGQSHTLFVRQPEKRIEVLMASKTVKSVRSKFERVDNVLQAYKDWVDNEIPNISLQEKFNNTMVPKINQLKDESIKAHVDKVEKKITAREPRKAQQSVITEAKAAAEELVRKLVEWGNKNEILDLTPEAVRKRLDAEAKATRDEAWIKKQEEVQMAMQEFVPRFTALSSDAKVKIRGSLSKGLSHKIGPGGKRLRFNPKNFDVDAFVESADLYEKALIAGAEPTRAGEILGSHYSEMNKIIVDMRKKLAQIDGNRDTGPDEFKFNVIIRIPERVTALLRVPGEKHLTVPAP